jgi:hypothetical protein
MVHSLEKKPDNRLQETFDGDAEPPSVPHYIDAFGQSAKFMPESAA